MRLREGDVYRDELGNKTMLPNKTRKYLLPCLKYYGDVFLGKLNSVFKVACGLGINNHQSDDMFILIDSAVANSYFLKFMDWIREQPYYKDDYVYGDIQKSSYHMVVLKIPEVFKSSVQKFLQGKYSEMYSYETIEKFFSKNPEVKQVLLKDNNYKSKFIAEVNKEYGTEIQDFDTEDYELDFPVNLKEEIFEV